MRLTTWTDSDVSKTSFASLLASICTDHRNVSGRVPPRGGMVGWVRRVLALVRCPPPPALLSPARSAITPPASDPVLVLSSCHEWVGCGRGAERVGVGSDRGGRKRTGGVVHSNTAQGTCSGRGVDWDYLPTWWARDGEAQLGGAGNDEVDGDAAGRGATLFILKRTARRTGRRRRGWVDCCPCAVFG